MIISHSKRFIFIHIYKVAGRSVECALKKNESLFFRLRYKFCEIFNYSFPKHTKAIELKKQLTKNVFNSYFKFAFVRNPWDWQVSLYHYTLEDKKHHQHKLISKMKSFDEYIEWRVNNEVRLQKDFIYDEEGNLLVDFVGRYENLEKDFKKICERIEIKDAKLPHKNKSHHKPYQEYYNNKTKKMVYDAFREDIKLFNYSFE